MAQPEARIVINRDAPDPAKTGRFAQAAADKQALADQVRKRRKEIHDAAAQEAMQPTGSGTEAENDEPAPVRENIDSIEFTLSDGRVIEYGPPQGISLSDRIARLYSGRPLAEGGPDPGITEYRLTRLLMGVRAVDGRPAPLVTNLLERTRLANILGDQAIDLINIFDQTHWPPLRAADLPVIKKKLRT